ncbi:MAG: UDP-N-acetylmuramate--L-alanine ligase [Fibrobacterota bacterium]
MIPLRRFPCLHFTGVGGAGMAPLAAWYAARGFRVTGTDRQDSSNLEWLRANGVDARFPHDPALAASCDLLVRTSAVGEDHVEVRAALDAGIPVVRRAEALGETTRGTHALCIAGTHGKTTTTLMTARILREAGLEPCSLPGGIPTNSEDALVPGAAGPLVVETDEYDRTFLRLHPAAAVITNLEEDHLDCYRDIDDLRGAFGHFLSKLPFHGYALLCADDAGAAGLASSVQVECLTYGLSPEATYRGVEESDGSVTVYLRGEHLINFRLGVPGRHNRLNALAALALSHREGADPAVAAKALAGFRGARRRLDLVGEYEGCPVFDDYAHHPTEIEATLQAVRELSPGRRIAVVFQPHLYSRTAHFREAFAAALAKADRAFVTPVYPARETPDQGMPTEAILEKAPAGSHLEWVAGREASVEAMRTLAQGDKNWTLLFVGAGDVGSWSRDLVPGGAA